MNKNSLWKILLLLLFSFTLTNCAHVSGHKSTISARRYLEMAANAEGTTKQTYLLKAANQFIEEHKLEEANKILSSLDLNSLPENLKPKYQLLQANLLILKHNFDQATPILQALNSQISTLAQEDQIALHQLLAYVYLKQGNVLNSLNERIVMGSLLPDNAQRANAEAILSALQQVDNTTLVAWSQNSANPALQGWAQFVIAKKNNQLDRWSEQYRNHPAQILLLTDTSTPVAATNSTRIALLLPLHGANAAQAQAIRNGFFAASNNNGTAAPNIVVLDTSSGDINAVYQQAVQQGAGIIVGPLIKGNLEQLIAARSISVPTLALNTIPASRSVPSRLYQFGLSPADEVLQVAKRARDDRHQNALVIVPASSWGQNLAQLFTQSWQSSGGQVLGQMSYTDPSLLSEQVQNLLQARTPESDARKSKAEREKLAKMAHRRQDVDMVFLIATPAMAREIKPLLNYYYANDLPVYATSLVYQGVPQPALDRDLDGITFCDIPWVLTPNSFSTTQQRMQTLWPNSYSSNPKLYALGVDAYNLLGNIASGRISSSGISAATGTLYLDKTHHIYRQLLWAEMRDGVPQLVR
jgi:outer membrane PBP1 activator LpoA protein